MRLNAIKPDDSPMEKLLFCFGSDGDDSDSGSDSTGFDEGDVGGVDVGGRAQTPDAGGGFGGGGGDAFDMSGAYVDQAISSFASPSVGVMATPMQAATGRAGFAGPAVGGGGGGSSPVSMTPVAPPMATGYGIQSPNFVQETIRGFMGPQTQTISQATGYPGGMNISPYAPGAATFADRTTARTYDPLGMEQAVRVNLGQAPGVRTGEKTFADRVKAGFEGAFTDVNQRAAMFDPQTGQFTTPTMEKVSDNRGMDFVANLLNPFKGLTGFIDTADYVPLAGGETYQFSEMTGGLLGLGGLGGPTLKSYADIQNAMNQGMGDGGDGATMMAETETEIEEEAAPVVPDVAAPYVPRQYAYQPFNANFYTIPSRFMSNPRGGLLG